MIPVIQDRHTFDSELQRAERFGMKGPDAQDILWLRMRICLVPVNPPKGKSSTPFWNSENIRYDVVRWNAADWQVFCDRYQALSTEHWNGNFLLIPSPRIRKRPDGELRTVFCGFTMDVVKDASKAHHVIPVVKLPENAPKFRSDSELYCDRDVWRELLEGEVQSPNGPVQAAWKRLTIHHEVGHLLGLPHPAAGRVKDPNQKEAYGSTLLERMGTMGSGPVQKLYYATPWQDRLARHTQTLASDWMPTWAGDAEKKGREFVVKAG